MTLPNYKFKMLITSEMLQYSETFLNLDLISLKIIDENFKLEGNLQMFNDFKSKVTKLTLKSDLSPRINDMFPNLYSLTLTPQFNSNLNELMQCVPSTVTNLHLDLSKFIYGFSFKLPHSIVFLEVMCHYLPYSHIIDSSNSKLEVLALTLYSESKQHHLKLTHLPLKLHFMEIRRCLQSEFVRIDSGNDKFMDHIQLVKRFDLE